MKVEDVLRLFHADGATATTVAEVENGIREAIAFQVEGLREEGLSVPSPSSRVEYVDVTA